MLLKIKEDLERLSSDPWTYYCQEISPGIWEGWISENNNMLFSGRYTDGEQCIADFSFLASSKETFAFLIDENDRLKNVLDNIIKRIRWVLGIGITQDSIKYIEKILSTVEHDLPAL